MMTRIILAAPCVGKTFLEKQYTNVYDFDKHYLEYKYNREDFKELSDEEFKGLPNRKIKDNWEELYFKGLIKLIEEKKYDVITVSLTENVLENLIMKGYNPEVIYYKDGYSLEDVKQRLISRGNNQTYIQNALEFVNKLPETFKKYDCVKVELKNGYLKDYLLKSGTKLYSIDNKVETYITLIKDMIDQKLPNLTKDLISYYALLSVNMLPITNEAVHNAWSLANDTSHKSLIPYKSLSEDVQDLDTFYRDVLREVQDMYHNSHEVIPSLKELSLMIEGI